MPKKPHGYQEKVIRELYDQYVAKSGGRHYLHMATGSGKTFTVMEFLAHNYLSTGKRVFWITHRWALIEQAIKELTEQHPKYAPPTKRYTNSTESDYECLAYFGSESNKNTKRIRDLGLSSFSVREFEKAPGILFSSWQSVFEKTKDLRTIEFQALKDFAPDLVVVDEAHYGKSGEMEWAVYEYLFNRYWQNVPMLGLSGTPKLRTKHGWSKEKLGNVHFSWLVEQGHLARPEVIEEAIPSEVKIQFDQNNWIKNESEIGKDRKRNAAIVDYYLKNRSKFGKTLIFAVDVEHANRLAKALRDRGESVIAIHSASDGNPQDCIDQFRKGQYQIAVAVDMMNEGIDVPDIRTIFLSRPVTSEILFAQMVGRGCRKIEGKKSSFYIVDFFSQTEKEENSRHLMHYKDWYNSNLAEPESVKPATQPKGPSKHIANFTPAMRTLKYEQDSKFYSALNGLKIDESQTFGIEFEVGAKEVVLDLLDLKEWKTIADPLLQLLKECFGQDAVATSTEYSNPKQIDHSVWNVVFDSSCGFEIVTPILKGKDGLEAVVKFLKSLNSSGLLQKHGLEVNQNTGTHVHLAWRYNEPEKVRRILHFMRKHEAAFHSLIAPSRVIDQEGDPNEYCQSVAARFMETDVEALQKPADIRKTFGDYEERYCALNLTGFDSESSTLEVRSHHGTLDENKITLWLALWMNVHNALERIRVEVTGSAPELPEPQLPSSNLDSDIIELATKALQISPDAEYEMLSRLDERRQELISNRWWTDILGAEGVDQIKKAWAKRTEKNLGRSLKRSA